MHSELAFILFGSFSWQSQSVLGSELQPNSWLYSIGILFLFENTLIMTHCENGFQQYGANRGG